MTGKRFISAKDVETQKFDWGLLSWLSEPRVTGTDNMTAGLVALEPGKGHERHNHPGCEEILYVIEGIGLQTVEDEGTTIQKTVTKGDMIHIPADGFHSTINTGEETLLLLAVYQYPGPEAFLRSLPECEIIPPEND